MTLNHCFGSAVFALLTTSSAFSLAAQREVRFSIVETTDIHGNYFDYDFVHRRPSTGGMSRVASYLKRLRAEKGRFNVLYVDNGDILQGQPTAYYYNYVDTASTHLAAAVVNELDALCTTVGNHDIETGHAVYDRWMNDCAFSVLGANVFDTAKKKPYFTAYIMENVDGVNVGVLGITSPCVVQTVPDAAWSGLDFRDLTATAQRIVPIMRRNGAKVVVVLAHTGVGREGSSAEMLEHAAYQIAEQVPDIDIVFCGHDHRLACRNVVNRTTGREVVVLNAAHNGDHVAQADVHVVLDSSGRVVRKQVSGQLVNIANEVPDPDFVEKFRPQAEAVRAYTERVVGRLGEELSTRPAYFGSSAFVDLIHHVQLTVSGADVSMAAPLSFDATVPAGEIRMGDLFNLYPYENSLFVVRMTGEEIRSYLEESYAGWTAQMATPADHLLRFRQNPDSIAEPWQRLQRSSYNYDSAAGIRYTVDVRRPKGEKIKILSMADGTPFSPTKDYRVALNSYRALGGGGILEQAVGLTRQGIKPRLLWQSPRELRHYMMEEIARHDTLMPKPLDHWRFIPEGWVANAGERDYEILFR